MGDREVRREVPQDNYQYNQGSDNSAFQREGYDPQAMQEFNRNQRVYGDRQGNTYVFNGPVENVVVNGRVTQVDTDCQRYGDRRCTANNQYRQTSQYYDRDYPSGWHHQNDIRRTGGQGYYYERDNWEIQNGRTRIDLGRTRSGVDYGDPRYGDPRYGDPRYGDPRYGDPRYGDPRYGGRYETPRDLRVIEDVARLGLGIWGTVEAIEGMRRDSRRDGRWHNNGNYNNRQYDDWYRGRQQCNNQYDRYNQGCWGRNNGNYNNGNYGRNYPPGWHNGGRRY